MKITENLVRPSSKHLMIYSSLYFINFSYIFVMNVLVHTYLYHRFDLMIYILTGALASLVIVSIFLKINKKLQIRQERAKVKFSPGQNIILVLSMLCGNAFGFILVNFYLIFLVF